jgi:hypothetical protein
VAVLGSSRPRPGDPDYETARAVGQELARRGALVVCGGYGGTMEAVCRGTSEAGGESIGVVIDGSGPPNAWVSRAVTAADLADRLRLLRDFSRAAIFLPHGLGTMLELVFFAESIVKGDIPPRPLVLLGDAWKGAVEIAIGEASTADGRARLRDSVRYADEIGPAVAGALGGEG